MAVTQPEVKKTKKNILDLFVEGGRKGWATGINTMLPNICFAFVLINILELTGLSKAIGIIFNPVMLIFDLPGIAATALAAGFFSMGGGAGVAMGLVTNGTLTARELAILLPGIYLVGATIQYMGRLLATIGIKSKYYPHLFLICIINAVIAMFLMKLIV